MKAIILAAGEGKRLKPLTNDRPKCLLELGNKSILDWQIDTMHLCGISDIVVVKGYSAEKIIRKDVRYYANDNFKNTNMVITLWCAEPELEGEIIVSYGDIIYNHEVLQKLIDSTGDISVVVDTNWQQYWQARFEDPLKDAEALKMDADKRIKVIGQKAEKISDVEAGYIGLIKFRENGLKILKKSFSNAKDIAKKGEFPWGASRSFETTYMTDMLQGIINEGHNVYGVSVNGGWLEIDSHRDYDLAKKLFINGEVISLNEASLTSQ